MSLSVHMKLWKTGGQPESWTRSIHIPVPKKLHWKKHTIPNQSHWYCMEAITLFWKRFKNERSSVST